MLTQQPAVCRLAHLSINDICNVARSQQRHSNKLKHVWQIGLSLFSVVLDPVQHGFKYRLFGIDLMGGIHKKKLYY